MQKTIEYKGTSITVVDDGTIIWNGKVRNQTINKDGYPVVSIKTKDGRRSIGVHRLVATAFVPNPNNYKEVDHINFNRTDYSIENLQWITHEENVRRSKGNLPDKRGEKNPNYGNRKLSQFYKEHPEIAKQKQSRPGAQNGRYIDGRRMLGKV